MHLRRFSADDTFVEELLPLKELDTYLQPYFVLARRVHAAAKVKGKNDWFWGSLLEGKWLYGQVLGCCSDYELSRSVHLALYHGGL